MRKIAVGPAVTKAPSRGAARTDILRVPATIGMALLVAMGPVSPAIAAARASEPTSPNVLSGAMRSPATDEAKLALEDATSRRDNAKFALDDAQAKLDAAQKAADTDPAAVAAKSKLDAATKAKDAAQSNLDAANAQKSAAQKDVSTATSNLEQANAALAAAKAKPLSDYPADLSTKSYADFLSWIASTHSSPAVRNAALGSIEILKADVPSITQGATTPFTVLGGPKDATNMVNVEQSLDMLDKTNELRRENGLSELKVCLSYTAREMLRTNCSAKTHHNHCRDTSYWNEDAPEGQPNVLADENVAANQPSVDSVYALWYDKGKADYEETGNKEYGGHYLNIVQEDFNCTGVAYSAYAQGDYGQLFVGFPASSQGALLSVSEYRQLFEQYKGTFRQPAKQADVDAAQAKVDEAASALDAANKKLAQADANVTSATKALADATKAETDAKKAYDAAVSAAGGDATLIAQAKAERDSAQKAYDASVRAFDVAHDTYTNLLYGTPKAAPKGAALWPRVYGNNAYDTMQKCVQRDNVFKAGRGGTVIVATGDGYWDALAASGLAGCEDAPIVTTPSGKLGKQAQDELQRLRPTKVVVMGGTFAVSDNAYAQIQQTCPGAKVSRVFGNKADDTAVEAYKAGSGWGDTCVIATVDGYWDALSIAPYAYAKKAPIFLTNMGSKRLSDTTLKAIRDGGFKRVVVVGGTGAVPAAVDGQLAGFKVTRLYGKNAIDTSAAIAKWELGQGMTTDHMAVATGQGYWDALAGAPLVGKQNSVLVLVNNKQYQAADAMAGASGSIQLEGGYVLGGTSAVPEATRQYLSAHSISVEAAEALAAKLAAAATQRDAKDQLAKSEKAMRDAEASLATARKQGNQSLVTKAEAALADARKAYVAKDQAYETARAEAIAADRRYGVIAG